MELSSFEGRVPNKLLLGFDFQQYTIKELLVEASIDFYRIDEHDAYYGMDIVDVMIDIILTAVEKDEPIDEVLDKEIPSDAQPERELKDFLSVLHLRLVATLATVGCYDQEGNLMYRFMKPIDCGFLLERIWANPSDARLTSGS